MKSNKSVVYLVSGPAHLPYLVVSLYTLRQYWGGSIIVYSWPESIDIVSRIAEDARLLINCYEREPKLRRKDGVKGNSQFLDKIDLMRSLDCEAALYLDADTMVNNPVDPLFDMIEGHEFVATQFNQWCVDSKMIRGRVSKLLGVEGINQDSVNWVLENEPPSVNGGVFVCRPETEILDKWYDWTILIKKQFIADECILHGLIGEYRDSGKFAIAMGGQYNCAPKFSGFIDDKDVILWHFHGDSNVRPNKTQKGFDLWWPKYRHCLEQNIGGMQEWISQINNKHLKRIEGWDKI